MEIGAFKKYNYEKSFKEIFKFKGEIAPIAEKACKNFDLKHINPVNREQRLHYFAVGHTFKHIDTENVFKLELDDEARVKKATRYFDMLVFDSEFIEKAKGMLGVIHNINSHYVHDFEKIKLDTIDSKIIRFLKQSFELAVIHIYLKEKEISYEEYIKTSTPDLDLLEFMQQKFFALDAKKDYSQKEEAIRYKAMSDKFKTLTKEEAIDALLFVEVAADFDWKLFDSHPVFTITKGKYLSFYASLFLLSLFLYKSEANQLISKIKGFKKNKEKEEKSKREIFSFFSKRFSSQDINSEENDLIKFRDIIQYLNHYPVAWNKEIELEAQHPQMTDILKAKIIEMEINRSFANDSNKYASNPRFHAYARHRIWKDDAINNDFTFNEKREFSDAINTSRQLRNAGVVLEDLKAKHKKTGSYNDEKAVKDQELAIEKITKRNEPNRELEKLKHRVQNKLLFTSYGRNQDRFMDFAVRFLAENNFFGKEAEFKTYQFYITKEQEDEMVILNEKVLNGELPKKNFDKLKFHQGKLVHFSTFEAHLQRYPSWDTPFVIENNAIQVKLNFGADKIVSLQRGLLIYLLEVALYSDKIEGKGKLLLTKYFFHHKNDYDEKREVLELNSGISAEQKPLFKKLLPKRLLNRYSAANQNNLPLHNTLLLILKKAEESEVRYNELLENARVDGNYNDFIKRNKGKQFKLQFVRKAWHLMYFKESYNQQVAVSGHHKRFHIERDEFNNFSRYMFAFDEVPAYKTYLTEMLQSKGFLDNAQFKTLYENGNSLNDLYIKTKQSFELWLTNSSARVIDADKYTLERYSKLLQDDMFYINISHFIEYLKSSTLIQFTPDDKLTFKSLENATHLIPEYYYTTTLAKEEVKSNGKLYNKLSSTRLEDALLLEIATRYLATDKQIMSTAKCHVTAILNQNMAFDIKDANNAHLYKLTVPFSKLDSFVALQQHKLEQDGGKYKSSFLANLTGYLQKVKADKDIKAIYEAFEKTPSNRTLTFDQLGKIDSHLINNSIKFTNLALTLEHYLINKNAIKISSDNRIDYDDVKVHLKPYFSSHERNKAFHFALPTESYQQQTLKIENVFIKNEIHPCSPMSYNELSWPQKSVCDILLKSLHNSFFGREKDGVKKQKDAEGRFYKEVICR